MGSSVEQQMGTATVGAGGRVQLHSSNLLVFNYSLQVFLLLFQHSIVQACPVCSQCRHLPHLVNPLPSMRTTIQQPGSRVSPSSKFFTYSYCELAIKSSQLREQMGHAQRCLLIGFSFADKALVSEQQQL